MNTFYFELQAEYKNNPDNVFYKKVEYKSKARRVDSELLSQQASDWVADNKKTFNLSNNYCLDITKKH